MNNLNRDKTDVDSYNTKHEKLQEKINELKIKVYKKWISDNQSKLLSMNLTEDESIAIKYLYTNPKICLIIDDCAKDIKPIQKSRVFLAFMTRGRWENITLLFATQAIKYIEKDARDNALVSIFCKPAICSQFFATSSEIIETDDNTNININEVISSVFNNAKQPFNKLVFIEENVHKFQYTCADKIKTPIEIGSQHYRDYCKSVLKDSKKADLNKNPMSKRFLS